MPRGRDCGRYYTGELPCLQSTSHSTVQQRVKAWAESGGWGVLSRENTGIVEDDDKKPSVGCCSIQTGLLPEVAGQARQTRQSCDRESVRQHQSRNQGPAPALAFVPQGKDVKLPHHDNNQTVCRCPWRGAQIPSLVRDNVTGPNRRSPVERRHAYCGLLAHVGCLRLSSGQNVMFVPSSAVQGWLGSRPWPMLPQNLRNPGRCGRWLSGGTAMSKWLVLTSLGFPNVSDFSGGCHASSSKASSRDGDDNGVRCEHSSDVPSQCDLTPRWRPMNPGRDGALGRLGSRTSGEMQDVRGSPRLQSPQAAVTESWFGRPWPSSRHLGCWAFFGRTHTITSVRFLV
jgi:hypothetical protein